MPDETRHAPDSDAGSAGASRQKLEDAWTDLLRHFRVSRDEWGLQAALEWSSRLDDLRDAVITAERQYAWDLAGGFTSAELKRIRRAEDLVDEAGSLMEQAEAALSRSEREEEKFKEYKRYYNTLVAESGSPGGPFSVFLFGEYAAWYRAREADREAHRLLGQAAEKSQQASEQRERVNQSRIQRGLERAGDEGIRQPFGPQATGPGVDQPFERIHDPDELGDSFIDLLEESEQQEYMEQQQRRIEAVRRAQTGSAPEEPEARVGTVAFLERAIRKSPSRTFAAAGLVAAAFLLCAVFGGIYLARAISQQTSAEPPPPAAFEEPVPFSDWDADQIRDQEDNCPLVPNPNQHQLAGRDLGWVCDDDPDADGVPSIYDPNPVGPGAWDGAASPMMTLLNPEAFADPDFEGPGLMEIIPFANEDPDGSDLLNVSVYPATSAPLDLSAMGELELTAEQAGFEATLECTQYPEFEANACEGTADVEQQTYPCWGALDEGALDVSCALPPQSAADFAASAGTMVMSVVGEDEAREFEWSPTPPEDAAATQTDEGSDCLTPEGELIPCAHEYSDVESFDADVEVGESGAPILSWMIETGGPIPEDGTVDLTLVQTLENSSTQEEATRFVYFFMTGGQWTYSGASLDGEMTLSRFQLPQATLEVDDNRIEVRQAIEGPVVPRVTWGGWLFDYEIQESDYAADEFPGGFFDGMTPGWGVDFPNEAEANGLLFTRPMGMRVDAPLQAYNLRLVGADSVEGLMHDCPYGNLYPMSAMEYLFWFRQRPEEEGTCASGTMFSAADGGLTFGDPWSGPEPGVEPWFKPRPGWNLVSMPQPERIQPVERSGAYMGSIAVESDPGGHQGFGWRLGEVEFDVEVEGRDITLGPVRGWNFVGMVGPEGDFSAAGTGTYAGFGAIQGTFDGSFTYVSGLNGLITIGTNQGLPGGQPISYNIQGSMAGTVLSDNYDADSGVGTQLVDLDGDGRADFQRNYDPDGNVIDELALDQSDLVTGAVLDAESGIHTKWVDTDGDGGADVVRRYDEEGALIDERVLDGAVIGAQYDAESGVTSEWVDLQGDGQPDVIRRFDREGALIDEERAGDGDVVGVSFEVGTGNTTQWIDTDGDGGADLVRVLGPDNQVVDETVVDGGRLDAIVSENFDASTGTTARTVDTDGDGRADVLRTLDGEGQLLDEVDLEATGGGVIVDQAFDAQSGTTTRTVDLDLDGRPDVLQIYDENDELIEEHQLDADGEAVILGETFDAESGLTTRTVDTDGDGEADVERVYDGEDVLLEERELRGPLARRFGVILPLASGAICLGVLLSMGIAGAVLLLGWNWAWDSGPTRAETMKGIKDQLGQLETHEVRKIIQQTRKQMKAWGRGGMIAEIIRDKADEVLERAEVEAMSGNKEGAIQSYLDGLDVLEGLEALAVFKVFLEESIQTFLLKTPGFLKLLRWLAGYKKWSRIAEILRQLEKIKDAGEKAKKLKELREEVERIEEERLKHAPK